MVQFSYQSSYADYRAFSLWVARRALGFLQILSAVLLLVYLLTPITAGRLQKQTAMEAYRKNIGLLFVPAIALAQVVATRIGIRKRWQAAEELRIPREYQIDAKGVSVRGESFAGHSDWSHILSAEAAAGFVYLRTGQNMYYYFPVAVVPDFPALAALLKANVAKTKNLG